MGKRVKFTVYAESQADLDTIRKAYANDTRVILKCQNCGIPISKVLKKIIGRPFDNLHCRHCGILLGTLEKYGVVNVFQLESVKETMKKTCLKKYGVEFISQDPGFRKRVENSVQERYGVKNITQCEMFKEKSKQTRYKKNNGKYRSDDDIKRAQQTCLERYGYKTPFISPETLEKGKMTMKKKYGSNYFFGTDAYKKKMTELYGGNNPMYSYELISKMRKRYNYNGIHFDSSWEVAYYMWLKDNCNNFIVHPKMYFDYIFQNEKHRYYPDFLVDGKYIEIKGPHLLNEMQKENTISNAKYNCMIENNVIIISDMKPYFNYLKEKYDIRPDDLQQYRNK